MFVLESTALLRTGVIKNIAFTTDWFPVSSLKSTLTLLILRILLIKQHYSATRHSIISNSRVIQRELLFNCVFAMNIPFGLGP